MKRGGGDGRRYHNVIIRCLENKRQFSELKQTGQKSTHPPDRDTTGSAVSGRLLCPAVPNAARAPHTHLFLGSGSRSSGGPSGRPRRGAPRRSPAAPPAGAAPAPRPPRPARTQRGGEGARTSPWGARTL